MNFCLLILFCLLSTANVWAAEDSKKSAWDLPIEDIFSKNTAKVQAQADTLEYDKDTKKIIARNNVTLTYQNTHITSDYAEVETETKKAYARGHVMIFQKNEPRAEGHEIHYDFENESGSFPDGRSISMPWFSKGEDIQQIREGVKIVKKGNITTCDLKNPHYEFRAKKITIYEKDKMIAWNVWVYILGKKVFWLPYMVIPLQDYSVPFAVIAGHTNQFGYFIGIMKGFSINKNIGGKFRVDWRSKRGFGAGADLNYDFKKMGYGILNLYLADDEKASNPTSSDNPYHENEQNLRGRITYKHRTDINPDTYILMRYNRLADEFFLQEFFEKEYRSEIEPNSFISMIHNGERYGILAHTEKRMNKFERTVERLPQLQFDWREQTFAIPGIYYQSQLSYNSLAKRHGRSDIHATAERIDNLHEWSVPLKWNEIKATPYTQFRGTYYSRNKESDHKDFRVYGEWGADLRTHFYRTFPVHTEKMGMEINQIRHLVEPYIKTKVGVSTISNEKLEEFDSVDRLDDSAVVTMGFENRIQTKRMIEGKMQRVDIVSMNTYLSYEFHPDGMTQTSLFAPYETDQIKSGWSLLGQELTLRPFEWLQYELRLDYDLNQQQCHVLNHDIIFSTKKFRNLLGERMINGVTGREDTNQFVWDSTYALNKLWRIGAYTRWEAKTQELDEWALGFERDLHDFILRFGYTCRNSAIENNNATLYFEMLMKPFPNIGIHSAGSKPSFSAPRIGATVAGSKQGGYDQPSFMTSTETYAERTQQRTVFR